MKTETQWWRSSIDARPPPRDPSTEEPVEHLLVGEIASAHGLRGEVSVKVLSEDEGRFSPGSRLLVGSEPAGARLVEVEARRVHSGRSLVKFSGVGDRTGAESLRGLLVFVESDQVAPLEAGAFWEHELAGAKVVDNDGRDLGTLAGVEERLEQDIWSVETGSGTVLLPAAKDIVLSVDAAARRIVVDPPEGLFGEEPGDESGDVPGVQGLDAAESSREKAGSTE